MLYTWPAVCIGFYGTCTLLHTAVNIPGTEQSAPQLLKTTKF